jgi:hypothetical protein
MFIFIVILIVIVIIGLVYCFYFPKQEHFENKISKQYTSQIYQQAAMERCEPLYADIATNSEIRNGMSEKSLESMDNYILGLRFREWEPVNLKDKSVDPNKGYCYVMYDSNHNLIDPIMQGKKCDMTDPIFSGVKFINNVFIDQQHDITHTLPYTKCVLEVEKSKVDTSKLDKFWSRMGDTQCTQYKKETGNEITNLGSRLNILNKELVDFQTTTPQYESCMKTQNILNTNINFINHLYSLSNCAFSGDCKEGSGSVQMMEKTYDQLRNRIIVQDDKLANVSKEILATQKTLKENEGKFNENNLIFYGMSNAVSRCSNIELPQKTRDLTDLTDEVNRLRDTNMLITKQLDNCTKETSIKDKEYTDLIDTTIKLKALWAGSNSRHVSCLSMNDNLRGNIAAYKDNFQQLYTRCNECSASRVLKRAERDALLHDVSNLTLERDDWLQRCKFDQSNMLSLSIATIDQLRTASTQYTHNNCGNDMKDAEEVNNLIQKKFKALAQLSAPPGCDENRRLECCRSRGYE